MSADHRPFGWGATLAVNLGFFLFYLYHLAPEMQWGDSARLGRVAYEGVPDFVTGGGHGLTSVLGWAFGRLPFPHPWTQNLLSAVCSTATLAVFLRTLAALGLPAWPSAIAGAALGVSHTFWFVSEIHESYALLTLTFALFLRATVALLADPTGRRMAVWATCVAAGILNHHLFFLLGGIAWSCLFFLLERVRRPAWVAVPWGVWLASAALLTGILGWANGPARFAETFRYHVGHYVGAGGYLKAVGQYGALLAYQFAGPALILGLRGIPALARGHGRFAAFLLALFVANILFASSYGLGRRMYLFLPAHMIFALAAGFGCAALLARMPSPPLAAGALLVGALALPTGLYALTPRLMEGRGESFLTGRNLPHLDANRYYLWPGKRGEDGAARFAAELRRAAGPGGAILADYKVISVLKYDFVLHGDDGIALVQTDDFAWLPPGDARIRLGKILDDLHGERRRVVLADRGSLHLAGPDGIFDAAAWLEAAQDVVPLENCFLVRPKGGEFAPSDGNGERERRGER